VQPGGDPGGARLRQVARDRVERDVAAAAVERADAAQVAREVVVELLAPQVGAEVLGRGEPADADERAHR
jgi:hypothetical protein